MPLADSQQPQYRVKLLVDRIGTSFPLWASGRDDSRRHAPYKVYKGDELKGTYATRAEARRRQQQLESQQAAGSDPQRHFIIKDSLGRVVI
jgi:hypothetical protein